MATTATLEQSLSYDQLQPGQVLELTPDGKRWAKEFLFTKDAEPEIVLVNKASVQPQYGYCTLRVDVLLADQHWLTNQQVYVQAAQPHHSRAFRPVTDPAVRERLEANKAAYLRANIGPLLSVSEHSCMLGSDPEIFVTDKDGKLLPAFAFLPKKAHSNPIFWDGYQAEFTVQADLCLAWLVDRVHDRLESLKKVASAHSPGAKLSLQTVFQLDPAELHTQKASYVALGCAASKNVYGVPPLQVNAREMPFRMSGGHIHFGKGNPLNPPISQQQMENSVKVLDAIVGVASVSLFQGLEHPIRREYYGKAGEYRLPSHGLEYRTLSNAWLCHPAIMNLTFDLARAAFKLGLLRQKQDLWDADDTEVQTAINQLDVNLAQAILRRNEQRLRSLLAQLYVRNEAVEGALKAIYNGVISVLTYPTNIEHNWRLAGKRRWVLHSDGDDCNWSRAANWLATGAKIP